MLLKFSVGNYLSFKDIQTLSLEADSLKELPGNLHIPYHYSQDERVLKSVAVYGHNSHGKSNLVKAFQFFQSLIFNSFMEGQSRSSIRLERFRLNTEMANKPTFFEIQFLIRETRYTYRLLLTSDEILEEGLYYSQAKIRDNYLFERKEKGIKVSRQWSKDNNNNIESLVNFARPHILFISVLLSQLQVTCVSDIGKWLRDNTIVPDIYMQELSHARRIYSDPDYRSLISKFIEAGDLGFTTIFDKLEKIQKTRALEMGLLQIAYEKEIKDFQLYTSHDVFDKAHKYVDRSEFELIKDESAGSIKYFIIVCLLARAIKNSQLIWIDELDARFHGLLFEMLVTIFHNPAINPINAQLIFTTHSTNVLDKKMRRDQIVMIDKNEWGESSISRAHRTDKPIRIDKSLEKEYKKGNLGGISKKIKKDLGPTLFDDL
jgi:AAA15 family ATPase/GTPase